MATTKDKTPEKGQTGEDRAPEQEKQAEATTVQVDILPPEAQDKKKLDVAYLGNHRVHHTLSGKVFEWGTKHTLTAAEARDLFARTADGEFEVV